MVVAIIYMTCWSLIGELIKISGSPSIHNSPSFSFVIALTFKFASHATPIILSARIA